jgi:4-hydroxy-tetrahydrodipicolinate synthase
MTIRKCYAYWFRPELFIMATIRHHQRMGARERVDLSGLWVPVVTPFDRHGAVDPASLDALVTQVLDAGADGVVALGTTGEPATLDHEERRLVVETCDARCRQADRGLLVGAGTNSTRGTIEEIRHLTAGTSARAALVVVPYYTRPSRAAVVEHFTTVTEASPVPVVVYNVPYRTGCALGAQELRRLSRHPRIVGLKQAVGGLDADTLDVLAQTAAPFPVLAGDDAFIAPTVLMGGTGAIAAAAHACTPIFVEMIASARAGDRDRSVALANALLPVIAAGFGEPSPAVWKGFLARRGRIRSDELRRPMRPASSVAVDRLSRAVDVAERRYARQPGGAGRSHTSGPGHLGRGPDPVTL